MKGIWDQSVLSCLTKIPLPPAGIIAQVTCQIQPLTLMTGGKAWNKDLLEPEDQSHGNSSVPLPIWHLFKQRPKTLSGSHKVQLREQSIQVTHFTWTNWQLWNKHAKANSGWLGECLLTESQSETKPTPWWRFVQYWIHGPLVWHHLWTQSFLETLQLQPLALLGSVGPSVRLDANHTPMSN